jgi:hypothetical protein
MQKTTLFLIISIALIQIFDIILHATTNQLEIIRVVSNFVILVWLGSSALGKSNNKFALIAIGIYLLLNTVFLLQNGFTNPQQNGELRVMFFVLVILTAILSGIYINSRLRKSAMN